MGEAAFYKIRAVFCLRVSDTLYLQGSAHVQRQKGEEDVCVQASLTVYYEPKVSLMSGYNWRKVFVFTLVRLGLFSHFDLLSNPKTKEYIIGCPSSECLTQ